MSAPDPVLVDTDGGLDDVLALLFTARYRGLAVQGVSTVHGNVAPTQAAASTLRILELLGHEDIPVALGAAAPRARPVHYRHPDDPAGQLLGASAREPSDVSAVEQIISCARAYPGQLSLLALGPLTNLAAALQADPGLPLLLRRVVAMAGVFRGPGNISTAAESNVWHDPEAAATVTASGCALTVVGLELTNQLQPDTGWWQALATDDPHPWAAQASALAGLDPAHRPAVPLHDPLAAAALANPAVLTTRPGTVTVDLSDGATRGRTHTQPDETSSSRVGVTVDVEAALAVLQQGILPHHPDRTSRFTRAQR